MIAFTFPGQGSQRPGMGRAWTDDPSWALVDELAQLAGRDLRHLLLDADQDELRATANAQLATLTTSLLALDAVRRAGVTPGATAGHSLGEYTALVAGGVLSPAAAMSLVAARAGAMQAAADATPGTMAAVLGLDDDEVARACAEAEADAWVANLNAPGQAVIAGSAEGVAAAGEQARALGAKKVLPLPVGGAFHSPLMAPASAPLAAALADAPLTDALIPIVSDVDGTPHRDAEEWRGLLLDQLTSPVRWRQVQHGLFDLGVSALVELGPGGVLTGLAKRTLRDTPRCSVAGPDDVAAVVALADEAAPGASPPDGDALHGDERMIISPVAGAFEPGDHLSAGDTIDRGHLVGRVGGIDVRSLFGGLIGGVLALPGERLTPAQPIAWLWAR